MNAALQLHTESVDTWRRRWPSTPIILFLFIYFFCLCPAKEKTTWKSNATFQRSHEDEVLIGFKNSVQNYPQILSEVWHLAYKWLHHCVVWILCEESVKVFSLTFLLNMCCSVSYLLIVFVIILFYLTSLTVQYFGAVSRHGNCS